MHKPSGGKKMKATFESHQVVSTIKQHSSPKLGLISWVALACVLVLSLGQCSDAYNFVQHDPLVWRVTNEYVRIGTGYVRFNYKPISPCDMNANQNWASERDVKKIAYSGLETECRKEWDGVNLQLIQEFIKSFKNSSKDKNSSKGKSSRSSRRPFGRQKRELITLSVIAVIVVISIVGWLGQCIYSYASSDSSYNRLNEKDKQDQARDDKISKMELQIREAKEIRSELINITGSLDNEITSNTKAINHLATMMPFVSVSAANFTVAIHQEREMLKRMTYQAERSRASPDDYASMFRFSPLAGLKPEDTTISSMEQYLDGRISIDIYYQLYSRDTQIYKIQSLPHYVNLTQDAVLVRYVGPEYAIYNTTSNCAKGVADPAKEPTFLTCEEKDYSDPKLDKWVPVPTDDPDYERYAMPQRAQSPLMNVISCLLHNITINGVEEECPYFPFSLPTGIPFELPNSTHQFKSEVVDVFAENVNYHTPNFDERQGGSKTGTLIRHLWQRNQNSLEAKQFNFDKETLAIPLNALGIFALIGVSSVLIACGFCFTKCFSGRTQTPCGITNVITNGPNPPTVQAASSSSPKPQVVPQPPIRGAVAFSPPFYPDLPTPPSPVCYYATIDHGVTIRPDQARPGLPKWTGGYARICNRPLSF